jgi:hypothetical protein
VNRFETTFTKNQAFPNPSEGNVAKRKFELPRIFSRQQSFQLAQISVWGLFKPIVVNIAKKEEKESIIEEPVQNRLLQNKKGVKVKKGPKQNEQM